jgi:hypothetical protein
MCGWRGLVGRFLAFCASDPTLAQQCDTFLQNCLTATGVIDEQCAGGALFTCEGGPPEDVDEGTAEGSDESVTYVCPDCGAPMIIIDTFMRGQLPSAPPARVGES